MSKETKQHQPNAASHSINSDRLRAIVQEVIHRLQLMSDHSNELPSPQPRIPDRVVTANHIEQLNAGTKQVAISADAVVTPAARDAANDRGISIDRVNETITEPNHTLSETNRKTSLTPHSAIPNSATPNSDALVDADDHERGQLVLAQLNHRGVGHLTTRIVLSESPAKIVVHEVQRGEVAVMISALDQVERFAIECHPTAWVLDMKQLNLTAATNVAARIANLPRIQP
ncbi:MAG: hypothetical protein AAGG48_04650 [Planctomycetota bacterium]